MNTALQLQYLIVSHFQSLRGIYQASKELYQIYWQTDASTYISDSGIASGDQVTIKTKLTKAQFINMVTFCENTYKFFENTPYSTSTYMSYLLACRYGGETGLASNPASVEDMGDRFLNLANTALVELVNASEISSLYFANEIGGTVAVLSGSTMMFGTDVSAQNLGNAITLAQNFEAFILGGTSSQGDYQGTLAKWLHVQGEAE